MRAAYLALLALAASLACGGARAEEGEILTGTLKTVSDRGSVLIGYRPDVVPFSFLNTAGQPIGFTLDICHGIASDVAIALHRDLLESDAPDWQTGIRLVYVPIKAEERLPKIVSGEIDLECGSTTANEERGRTVAFSPVFFLAGTKLLVRLAPQAGKPVTSYRDLAGRTVAVGAGTTTAQVMRGLAASTTPPITVAEAPNLEAAFAMLTAGTADAFASDDILLAGFEATHPDAGALAIVGDYLSFEPYAVVLRRDDPAFAGLVRASFQRMAGEGTLKRLYARWFTARLPTGQTLNLPMGARLEQMYEALGQPD